MNTLQRYVLRETLAPMGLGLVVFTFVFLIGQMFQLTEYLLTPGIPAMLGIELILLILPSVMALTIPMAVLVGVLLGIGRLAADREILAIKASGISLIHLAKPIVILAIILSGAMMWANAKLIPYLNLKSADLMTQMLFHGLSAIPAGVPNELPTEGQSADMFIFINSKDADTGTLQGVTMKAVFEKEEAPAAGKKKLAELGTSGTEALAGATSASKAAKSAEKERKEKLSKADKTAEKIRKQEEEWNQLVNEPLTEVLIIAEQGKFEPQISERVVYVRLNKGSIHLADPDNKGAYDVIQFDTLTKGIVPVFDRMEKGVFERDPQEMSNGEIAEQIQVRDKGRKYSVELYQRFSVPLACIAFALIALPLAVYVRPTGKAVAFAISFLLILFYYGLLQYGVALGHANNPLGPVAIFLPNLVLAGIGGFMLYRVVTK